MKTPVFVERDNRKISDLEVWEFVDLIRSLNALGKSTISHIEV